jgi:hypothetical protein
MTAAGNAPRGTPAGQMFARGLGGAATGTYDAGQQQQNQLFNQSSQAFKDMMLARSMDNTEAYRTSQGSYLSARGDMIRAQINSGSNGSKTLSTPDQKVAYVESQAQKYRNQLRMERLEISKATGAPFNEAQIEADTETERQRLYNRFGMGQQDVQAAKTRGETQDNPFDTSKFTGTPEQRMQQFHQSVPTAVNVNGQLQGGWYKDQNGVTRQRTVPPPIPGGPTTPQVNGALAPNTDDMQAMQPAA